MSLFCSYGPINIDTKLMYDVVYFMYKFIQISNVQLV